VEGNPGMDDRYRAVVTATNVCMYVW